MLSPSQRNLEQLFAQAPRGDGSFDHHDCAHHGAFPGFRTVPCGGIISRRGEGIMQPQVDGGVIHAGRDCWSLTVNRL